MTFLEQVLKLQPPKKLEEKPPKKSSDSIQTSHSEPESNEPFATIAGEPVRDSPDLRRILALPRRQLDVSDSTAAEKWTRILAAPPIPGRCDCVKRWGYCITKLNPIQGHALEEANQVGGLTGVIGVGFGKTGLDILLPMVVAGVRVAVLVLPAKLRHQFLEQDYPQWSVHFRVPNLAGGSKFYTDGRPVLHVLSYEGLGQIKNSDILTRLRPDLIIADEAHKFKNSHAACTTRLEREMTPAMKFIPLSGTMTSRSPLDCGHLFGHSLKQGSPLPLHKPALEDWAGAVAASDFCRPAGALMALANPGEDVQEAFRRRLIETPGVIATETSAVSTSLSITALSVEVPEEVEALIRQAKRGVRPDGEEAIDTMTAAGWARQLSAGFYHRWIYPRGEPEDLIAKWFTIRKDFNKEIREKLKHRPEFMDSPGSLFRAAHRWHSGYKHQGVEYAPKTVKGPLPTWNSIYWPDWLEIRHQVEPQTDVVWVDDFLLNACERWGRANKGIIWTEHAEFGAVLAARLNTTWYHGEGMNPESEKGDRTIVCSIKANSDGLNLQHSFYKNLFASVPSSGLLWEQAIGRTHRPLQKADEVEVEVFLHTAALSNAFAQARLDARYQQGLTGPKKLCYADMDLKNAVE